MKVARAITEGMQENILRDMALGGSIGVYWLKLIRWEWNRDHCEQCRGTGRCYNYRIYAQLGSGVDRTMPCPCRRFS